MDCARRLSNIGSTVSGGEPWKCGCVRPVSSPPPSAARFIYAFISLRRYIHFFIAFTHKQTTLLRRHIFHDTYIYVFYRQHAAPPPQIFLRFWKARKVDVGIQVEKQVGQLFKG